MTPTRHRTWIIAIDGEAGAGKTTVAQILAQRLNGIAFSTGALYRALTYWILQRFPPDAKQPFPPNEEHLAHLLKQCHITVQWQNHHQQHVYINGEDVTQHLYSHQVEQYVSQISKLRIVRSFLLPVQRQAVAPYPLAIVEGRDIGTVVFPNAILKVYLTADPHVRIQRRSAQHRWSIHLAQKHIQHRDHIDRNRTIAPLQQAHDAYILDTTNLSIEEAVDQIIQWFHERIQQQRQQALTSNSIQP